MIYEDEGEKIWVARAEEQPCPCLLSDFLLALVIVRFDIESVYDIRKLFGIWKKN